MKRDYTQTWPAPLPAGQQLELVRRYRYWRARVATVRRVIRRLERDGEIDFWQLESLQGVARACRLRAEQSRNTLWVTTMRLVCGLAKKYHQGAVTVDDLVAVGGDYVLRAIERFDPDRGPRFVTYCDYAVRRGMWKELQEQRRRDDRCTELPDDRYALAHGHWSADDYESPSWGDRCLTEIREALDRIPAREREIVLARCRGETLPELARRRNLSKERVRQLERQGVVRVAQRVGVKVKKPLSLVSV